MAEGGKRLCLMEVVEAAYDKKLIWIPGSHGFWFIKNWKEYWNLAQMQELS